MKTKFIIIVVALCFIFFTESVSAESEERQWKNGFNGWITGGNQSSAIDPTLPPTETIDEVGKPNRTPLDEQLEILELWSVLTTLGTILLLFLFHKTHMKKVRY